MKTFDKLADAKKFIELCVIGTYGKGFTYSDLQVDLKQITKHMLTKEPVYIVIRETGTQGLFHHLLIAQKEYTRRRNCTGTIEIKLIDGQYRINYFKK